MGGVNRVILCGTIGKYGIEVRYTTAGTPCASFTLVVSEQGQDGREHATLGDLDAGQLVLFEGKLHKRKKGEQWELVVSGFEVTPVHTPTPALTGSN